MNTLKHSGPPVATPSDENVHTFLQHISMHATAERPVRLHVGTEHVAAIAHILEHKPELLKHVLFRANAEVRDQLRLVMYAHTQRTVRDNVHARPTKIQAEETPERPIVSPLAYITQLKKDLQDGESINVKIHSVKNWSVGEYDMLHALMAHPLGNGQKRKITVANKEVFEEMQRHLALAKERTQHMQKARATNTVSMRNEETKPIQPLPPVERIVEHAPAKEIIEPKKRWWARAGSAVASLPKKAASSLRALI
jgi:hypothetical protein